MTALLWPNLAGKPYVVDLSHNNPEPIDFAALKADGVELVIHKASQGLSMRDPLYGSRRKRALDAGLKWDAYHFFDGSPPVRQVSFFLSVAELDETMRGALDCEPNGRSTISFDNADAAALAIDDKRGLQAVRYTGAGFLTPKSVAVTPHFRAGPIWWAKYGPQPTAAQLKPLGIDPADIVLWQRTGSGSRQGVKGPVDESWFIAGGLDEIQAWPSLARFPAKVG